MKRVIIYCRKSEKPKTSQEKKEESKIISLDSQEKELKEYAQKNDLKIVKTFKENESAYKAGKRPLFDHMIQMFEAGKADSILL